MVLFQFNLIHIFCFINRIREDYFLAFACRWPHLELENIKYQKVPTSLVPLSWITSVETPRLGGAAT